MTAAVEAQNKRGESHAITGMNLGDIMFSQTRQSQKGKYCAILRIKGI